VRPVLVVEGYVAGLNVLPLKFGGDGGIENDIINII
jgi:hypothetical protein